MYEKRDRQLNGKVVNLEGRLVRDNVPKILRAIGLEFKEDELTVAKFRAALLGRIIEKSMDLQDAQSRDEKVTHLADLMEMLKALMEAEKVSEMELSRTMFIRVIRDGRFEKRTAVSGSFLISRLMKRYDL